MKKITIAIVDYGIGNHASVGHSLRDLGFRVKVNTEQSQLDDADVLLLPGVGAFPIAMRNLHDRGLVTYLQEQASLSRPLLGICLGMQLFANVSYEHGYTVGLGLIPGEIKPLHNHGFHIGWNTLHCTLKDSSFALSDGQAFYFNHSFYFDGPTEYQLATVRHPFSFVAAIRKGNIAGVQFHPEKSQNPGKILLKSLIMELVNA